MKRLQEQWPLSKVGITEYKHVFCIITQQDGILLEDLKNVQMQQTAFLRAHRNVTKHWIDE